MSCSHPLFALRLGAINPETGKEKIKILNRSGFDYQALCARYGSDNILQLPCGHCSNCIEARSRAWAVRCVLEASTFEKNCFLTLTYDNQHLSDLNKRHVQLFLKRLRAKFGVGIRYFACGEYGSHTHRAHYHLILFNFFPDDAKYCASSRFGGNYYYSQSLRDLWSFGHVSVGDVSFASCAYVARYCQKKLANTDGIVNEGKEFILMSRKPGLGEAFFRKYYQSIYETDSISFKFGCNYSAIPGRYFDKLFENIAPDQLELLKRERISNAKLSVASAMLDHGFHYVEELNDYNGDIKAAMMSKLLRGGI